MQCIVFDVFGTLYHYKRNIFTRRFTGTYDIAAKYFPQIEVDEFLALWKKLYMDSLRKAKSDMSEFSLFTHSLKVVTQISPSYSNSHLVARELTNAFIQEWLLDVTVSPEAETALSKLYSQYLLVAVTNIQDSSVVPRLMMRDGIDRYFSLIVSSAGIGVRKPAPAIVHYLVNRLQIGMDDLIIVGDDLEEDGGLAGVVGAPFIQLCLPEEVTPRVTGTYNSLLEKLIS